MASRSQFQMLILACFSQTTVPPPYFLLGGGGGQLNFQSQILKRGDQKKISAWGDLNSSCHGYLRGGLLCSLSKKKRLLKIKYGFKGSISNVDQTFQMLAKQLIKV